MGRYDLLVRGGMLFDGTGSGRRRADVGIRGGEVVAAAPGLDPTDADEVLDASGKWVMPGFVDIHTHYDVEMLAAPALTESLRHGVTTVVIGNCSLTTIMASNEECADIFSRVEAVPHEAVTSVLGEHRTWSSPGEYAKVVDQLNLGPNVAAFLGQSDMRAAVMGLGRALDAQVRPTKAEIDRMTAVLNEALDAGFLGMSQTTNSIDKMDGDLYRSKTLPTTFVKGKEFRALNKVLRDRERILQSTPSIMPKPNAHKFFLAASGWFRRKPLKVSLLASADSKAYPPLVYLMLYGVPTLNALLRTAFKLQHLPVPFTVYADGIDLVVFEEFGSGAAALGIRDQVERNELLQSEEYRRWFRRDYENKLSPKIWHRNLFDAVIVDCPDPTLIARSFGEIGTDRGIHPVDAYLDLVVQYGRQLRWRTTIANDRPKYLDKIAVSKSVHIGFGDAGAHLRNMAFYNYHVRLLERVHAAQKTRKPFMSIERAVHRVTGELARWFGFDAGHLRVGDRADIAIIDPARLTKEVHGLAEQEIPAYGGLRRMVNRDAGAVAATLVNGTVVYRDGRFADGLGTAWGPGRFLPAQQKVRTESSAEPATVLTHR